MSRHRHVPARPWLHGIAGFLSGAASAALLIVGLWTGTGGPLVQPSRDSLTPPTSSACVPSSTTYPGGQTWHGCSPEVFRPSLPARSSSTTTTPTSSAEQTPGPAQLPPNPFNEEAP